MLRRLKDSFDDGVEKIKWFSSLLSERLRIELSLMRLLYQAEEMEKKREELMKAIGKRVCELKDHSDTQVLRDRAISETLNEIGKIDEEIESTRKKASDISRVDD
jgi:seryl-tRNA synthetase